LQSWLLSDSLKIKLYKTIILHVVFYECETWSLTPREEHRMNVFENRMLRRMFGHKGEEVVGGWIRLHNEEFHDFFTSPNVIRVIKSRMVRWTCQVARMRDMTNTKF
jgi:hypothetical protein